MKSQWLTLAQQLKEVPLNDYWLATLEGKREAVPCLIGQLRWPS